MVRQLLDSLENTNNGLNRSADPLHAKTRAIVNNTVVARFRIVGT
jgi:hypothetical protein